MSFHAHDVARQLVWAIAALLPQLKQHSKKLHDEVVRATDSVISNVGEGSRRVGGDRLHHYRTAAGRAEEIRDHLEVAQAFGYLDAAACAPPLALADREVALLWSIAQDGVRVIRFAV